MADTRRRAAFLIFFLSFVLLPTNGFCQAADRLLAPHEELLMDFGWKFHLGNAASAKEDFGFGQDAEFAKAGSAEGAAGPDFKDSTWRTVNLPHDWAVEQEFVKSDDDNLRSHGFKPIGRQYPETSIGWYRRTFTIPKSDSGRVLSVRFDGVYRDCVVWLNGHYLGRNFSGYGEFSYDISDYVRYDRKNVLAVRVDATQAEGWFYEGAGIYRHTWLIKSGPVFVVPHGQYVTTRVDSGKASVLVDTKIENHMYSETDGEWTIDCELFDENGDSVAQASSEPVMFQFGQQESYQEIRIDNPQLWSTDRPYLYKLICILHAGGGVIDRTEMHVGVRSVKFDKDNGFFLNGKRVEIQGVCCHQDHAGVGSALPDRLQYYRIERLKEMGCNAYRTSHNPPTPELLDACDRLGMLVLDENRLMGSTPEFTGQFERQILRDRNHPSVIAWSIGNEEWYMQNKPTGAKIARKLIDVAHRIDPSRRCTYAGDNGTHYEGINSAVDVRGINYIGRGDLDAYHRDHSEQPVWGTEEASAYCTRGIYATDTVRGYVSDYDVNAPDYGSVAERWWQYYSSRRWLAGAFVWTGFDYRGEPSPYSWPCISSHFGIMDVCGFPKNSYYYYQANWSDRDVLHIFPHWNRTGMEGKPVNVWCFTNCDSVELSLNGRSLGTKPAVTESHLEWNIPYTPGVLEAKGWRRGRTLSERVETTGKPAAISLRADRDSIDADGEDVAVVYIAAVDDRGREVPDADNLIHFAVAGDGEIIGVGNGDPSSHEKDKFLSGGWQRRLFSGKAQLIVQSSRLPGLLTLKASADGLAPAKIDLYARQVRPRPSVPEQQ
jgi:beta-galactosidase